MSDEAVTELLGPTLKQFTNKTLDLPALLENLNQVRSSGFAFDFDEHTLGIGAIAMRLQTSQGHDAIDAVGPVWRMEQSIATIQQALLACRNSLFDAMRGIGT